MFIENQENSFHNYKEVDQSGIEIEEEKPLYERLIEEALIANPTRLSYTRVSNDTDESMRINKAV